MTLPQLSRRARTCVHPPGRCGSVGSLVMTVGSIFQAVNARVPSTLSHACASQASCRDSGAFSSFCHQLSHHEEWRESVSAGMAADIQARVGTLPRQLLKRMNENNTEAVHLCAAGSACEVGILTEPLP